MTTVPAQSLMLMNNSFVTQAAARFGAQTRDPRQMWLRALGREPSTEELAEAEAFVEEMSVRYNTLREEQAKIQQRIDESVRRRQALLAPVRGRLEAELKFGGEAAKSGPEPMAFWTFEGDFRDQTGNLHARPEGSAKLENGALILDGNGFAATTPLTRELGEKTLEAIVQLDSLDQRGGGVLTVQDTSGGNFDAIVFGERTPGHWLAGSNHHRRTENLRGNPETEATSAPVRIAIAYDADGTIRAYRHGKPHGKPYRKAELHRYESGKTQVVFGLRHGTGVGGNRMLRGRIFEAKLYDRALTEHEIAASAAGVRFVTEKQVLAALTPAKKSELKRLDSEIARLNAQRDERGQPAGENQPWIDLAHSLFNLKEFIYLR